MHDLVVLGQVESAGTCHSTITALNATSAVHGLRDEPPDGAQAAGPGPEQQRPADARRRSPTGRASSSGTQGAPATMRIGAKKEIRMCSIMWTKK